MKKIIALLLAALMGAGALTGCGTETVDSTNDVTEDTSLEDITSSGKIKLGLDADFAPMGFTDENLSLIHILRRRRCARERTV